MMTLSEMSSELRNIASNLRCRVSNAQTSLTLMGKNNLILAINAEATRLDKIAGELDDREEENIERTAADD